MDRASHLLSPTRWTLAALAVQLFGALWMLAGALYVAPLLVVVPLVPAALTAIAYAAQRQHRRVSPTILLALAFLGEAMIVVLNSSVYWQSAAEVLAVPTPPGTLEPVLLLTFSWWLWHMSLPMVAVALAAQVADAWRARKRVRESDASWVR